MVLIQKWQWLQLFAGEGGSGAGTGDGGDGGAGAAEAGVNASAPDAGESRLRDLGVPDAVLAKRANRLKGKAPADKADAPAIKQQGAAAEQQQTPVGDQEQKAKPTWDELMQDPDYNKQMQSVVQQRLRQSKEVEDKYNKLAPSLEVLARKYGLDPNNLDPEALNKAINDDDSYYEDKALEMGVPLETAKRIDQQEREAKRRKAEEEKTIQQQRIEQHLTRLRQQGEEMKKTFKDFDLDRELQNPAFFRMTSPNIGLSVEDAYYAVHRREIQNAANQVIANKTAQMMSNSIRSGSQRPVENGASAQSPSVTTFDYAHASKEQREALKRQIRNAAARGEKLYPGQR